VCSRSTRGRGLVIIIVGTAHVKDIIGMLHGAGKRQCVCQHTPALHMHGVQVSSSC
jgi:hypothetical protein